MVRFSQSLIGLRVRGEESQRRRREEKRNDAVFEHLPQRHPRRRRHLLHPLLRRQNHRQTLGLCDVALKGSVPISFGGTEQPAAYGELVLIGGLSPDVNKKLSAAISSILEEKLSVPKSRFFLKFYDTKGSNFGWNGSTF